MRRCEYIGIIREYVYKYSSIYRNMKCLFVVRLCKTCFCIWRAYLCLFIAYSNLFICALEYLDDYFCTRIFVNIIVNIQGIYGIIHMHWIIIGIGRSYSHSTWICSVYSIHIRGNILHIFYRYIYQYICEYPHDIIMIMNCSIFIYFSTEFYMHIY